MRKPLLLLYLLGLAFVLHSQEATNDTIYEPIPDYRYPIGLGVIVKAGTWGIGGDVVVSFSPIISARVGTGFLGGSYLQTETDYEIEYKLNIRTISAIANFQLLNRLYLAGGLIYNFSEQKSVQQFTQPQEVNSIEISPDQLGSVTNIFTWNKIAPYAGVGFGKAYSGTSRVFFAFEIGAFYSGPPQSALEASGMLHPTANDENQQTIEDNLKSLAFFPVISFQLGFRIL